MLQIDEVDVLTNHPSGFKDCFFHRLLSPNCDTSVQVKKRSTRAKQISQQVVENSEAGCQPGESEPINSTVPSLQESTAASLKRCQKRTRQKNVRSHLAPPQTGGNYLCSLLLRGSSGGSAALGSLALPPPLLSSKHSWRLGVWSGLDQKVKDRAVQQSFKKTRVVIQREREEIGICVIPSRCWDNWHRGESISGPRGFPKRPHLWFFKGEGFMSLCS